MTQKDDLAELLAEFRLLRAELAQPRRQSLIAGAISDKETPDPTPVELPTDLYYPETLAMQIQRYVREGLSAVAADQNLGTFEEEDDFTDENPSDLPLTGFEVVEFPMEEEEYTSDAAPPEGDPTPSETPLEAPAVAVPVPSETPLESLSDHPPK